MPPSTSLAPALFLDRDGVINEEINYLIRREDVRWVDGIFSLGVTAIRLGYKLIVVSNQAGVARGFFTESQVDSLMHWMAAEMAAHGAPLTASYYCPYHPRAELEPYRREHEDRKPSPGMLHRAAREHHLDLSRSLLVGDRCTDIGAANAAHLHQAFLLHGTEDAPCPGDHLPVASLAEVEYWLTRHTQP